MPRLDLCGTHPQNKLTIEAQAGENLLQAIWLTGRLAPMPLCNGLGLCGNCRCRFLDNIPEPNQADNSFFSPDHIKHGWRLSCRHTVPDTGCPTRIELPDRAFVQAAALPPMPDGIIPDTVFLAVDLGTTTIQWEACNADGSFRHEASSLNPQAPVGADIISRLEHAAHPGGLARLAGLALNHIGAIARQFTAAGATIASMCIAANSAMTEIFLNRDISGLLAAPYKLSFHGNEWINLDLPGLDSPTRTYFPPLLAPFVGGDTSSGLAALADKPLPFLLADLGTNAELALLTENNELFVVSAPLGPALEGIGPRNGQCAGPGVVTGFELTTAGLSPVFYRNEKPLSPAGISATGYLSLLAILLKLGIMSPEGQLHSGRAMPLATLITRNLQDDGLHLPYGLLLTLSDIELLLKVKATFTVAIDRLLQESRVPASSLDAIYLAGALGEFSCINDLETLGFLPTSLAEKTIKAGNTSLKGASIMARSARTAARIASICQNAHTVQLAEETEFMQRYLAAMHWGVHAF